jgi:endonuclease/exonuclease/phosphatase family metal-dependent hydrolase/8-oxo-dGTP pyrophosphatase MutT (NUDIX family)
VALFVHLRHIASGKRVLVVNTHITCNWRNPDMQTAQVAVMLQQIATVKDACAAAGQEPPEVIVCGDFNSFPDSGAYALLTEGQLGPYHPHANPSEDAGIEPVLAPNSLLTHALGLRSAYKTVSGAEPTATNAKGPSPFDPDGFRGCLDYIFTSGGLEPVRVVAVDAEELAREGGGLPNSGSPSDHIPIGAVLRIAAPGSPLAPSLLLLAAGGGSELDARAAIPIPSAAFVPAPVPPAGWEAHLDTASGDYYYFHEASGHCQWDLPTPSHTDPPSRPPDAPLPLPAQTATGASSAVTATVKNLGKEEPQDHSTVTNVTVTVVVGGKVLVCLRGVAGNDYRKIFSTGGTIDKHRAELPRTCAVRECLEESGISVQPSHLSYFNDHYSRRNYAVFLDRLPAAFGPDRCHEDESVRTQSICGVPTSEQQGRGRWALVPPADVLALEEDSPFTRLLRAMHLHGGVF